MTTYDDWKARDVAVETAGEPLEDETMSEPKGYGDKIDRLFDGVGDFTPADLIALALAAIDQAGMVRSEDVHEITRRLGAYLPDDDRTDDEANVGVCDHDAADIAADGSDRGPFTSDGPS